MIKRFRNWLTVLVLRWKWRHGKYVVGVDFGTKDESVVSYLEKEDGAFRIIQVRPFPKEAWDDIKKAIEERKIEFPCDDYFLQWLGEMEMFKQEGGLRAYNRYKEFLDKK